ncbi:MAG: DUF2341 domain-containing protein [Chitinivibrionales bacterium]|nr:DUF2341 domain-containing protein [Chitinivibrionales bacterium]MBD3396530.1 DUF2341 domain-containing protein [Chitinivibrionales bacterium]
MRGIKKTLLLACTMPLALVCTRDTNPFGDVANARVVAERMTFSARDTVTIFDEDTVDIVLAVADLVDSFLIEAEKNRYFSDSMVVRWGGQGESLYRFFFSFYDTGWHEIAIRTYRGGSDEELTERIRLYAVSPLAQSSIDALFGETVYLETPAVASADAQYHWDFGRGTVFNSPRPADTVEVFDASYSDSGWLWVSDLTGAYISPKTHFPFSFDDRKGPTIVCVNEGYVNEDTVMTGNATFGLRLKIFDRGEQAVYEATADGAPFPQVQDLVHIKMLYRMDTVSTYRAVVISATDDARHLNRTVDTFYVGYDASLANPGEAVQLDLLVPPGDSASFTSRSRYLFGVLWNYTNDSVDLDIDVTVGDSAYPSVEIADSAVRNEWYQTVMLSPGYNTILIRAIDAAGDTLEDTSVTVIYDAAAADTVPPQIVEVTADGEPADRRYTPDTSVYLRAIVFDEGSGVQGVTQNTRSMQPPTEGAGYIWGDLVSLQHRKSGNTFVVVARDKEGLGDTATVVIFNNNPPVIVNEPDPPFPLLVGRTYSDRISIDDADRDTVIINLRTGPDNFTVDAWGNISWTPTIKDTGAKNIEIQFTDGYEPQYYSFDVVVRDTADTSMPAFETTEEDFPAFLEVGADALAETLSVAGDRGTPPFTFGASAPAGITQPSVSGEVVRWIPQITDTGFQRLYATVTDSFERGDTLVPIILVVGPNQPCTLSLAHGVDTLSDGLLDFTNVASAETLTFTIHDPDHPLSENHTVSVGSSKAEVVSDVDSAGRFDIVVSPASVSADTDTVVVAAADRAGNTDTITVRMFRNAPYKVYVNTASAGVSEDVYGFPLLLRLTSSNFDFSRAQSGGLDVRFKKPDGTILPHEIERWDAGAGKAEIWVRIDTVKGDNSTQYFEMHFAGGDASSTSDGAAVFDTTDGFEAVWHLGGQLDDASPKAMDLTNVSSQEQSGIIGTARYFDGTTGKKIEAPDRPEIVAGVPAVTLTAWIKTESLSAQQAVVGIAKNNSGSATTDSRASIEINDGASNRVRVLGRASDAEVDFEWVDADGALTVDTWHHVAGVLHYAKDSLFVYVDGVLKGSDEDDFSQNTTSETASEEITIGSEEQGGQGFAGLIDELRVSGVRRPAAWIKLSYETQKSTGTAVTVHYQDEYGARQSISQVCPAFRDGSCRAGPPGMHQRLQSVCRCIAGAGGRTLQQLCRPGQHRDILPGNAPRGPCRGGAYRFRGSTSAGQPFLRGYYSCFGQETGGRHPSSFSARHRLAGHRDTDLPQSR